MESIVNTLGSGSGIDTKALVTQLVDAQFAAKNARYDAKSETLSAQISGISQIKSGISGFANALKSLSGSGALSTRPTSSDASVVTATALPGAQLGSLGTSLDVRRLASAQVAHSGVIVDADAAIGTGTLTLTFGSATVADGAMTDFVAGGGEAIDIAIDDSNNSLTGIAGAINKAGAGVTATVVSDRDGARLILKGETGEEQAFTLQASEDAGAPGLSALDIGVGASGTTIGTAAEDAIVAIDGVALKRPTNSIDDLIDGVKLDLVSTGDGKKVQIGTAPPTENLRQAVSNFVDSYNSLIGLLSDQTDPKTGNLSSDTAARSLQQSLSRLTLTDLVGGDKEGEPQTLAEIGVGTNRDGTLKLDSDQLDTVLRDHGDTIEKMFAPGTLSTGDGLPAALDALSERATSNTFGLGASAQRYDNARSDLTDAQAKAADDADATRERLTRQFAGVDARVAAYKSTQTFLEQQVDVWNAQK